MKHDEKNKGTDSGLSLFFTVELKVFLIIIIFSAFAFINTLYFEEVPPILNRGIQPATFPKILLVLITLLATLVYYLSLKNPWKKNEKLNKSFFLTLLFFILFVLTAIYLDFFLAISVLSFLVSFFWGERRILYLTLVSIIFPIIVFIFFEMILGLRFPGGIITNLYYT
tara:strand:+ start:985 stop:1491 length:507 start_codon:yes stop_codon:yes gene_type:complete